MRPGIYYLYEYENAKKLRNAGFLKLTRHHNFYKLKISVRNIPVRNEEPLHISMLFPENEAQLVPLLSIGCQERAVSALIDIPDSQLSTDYTLDNCEGILLTAAENVALAAVPQEISFDLSTLTAPDDKTTPEPPARTEAEPSVPEISNDTPSRTEAEPSAPEISNDTPSHTAGETSPQDEVPAAESSPAVSVQDEAKVPSHKLPQDISECEECAGPIPSSSSIRKIHRRELTCLPRRYWNLANNSFLMHGYHNYNHLLLIEEDGHYWLGVPGIYDPQEARAAELFGFPQFTDNYNDLLHLTTEERNDFAPFGYWCRYISL